MIFSVLPFHQGKDAKEVFHSYLNLCPHQGSRTIRSEVIYKYSLLYFLITEREKSDSNIIVVILFDYKTVPFGKQEAVFIALQYFQEPIDRSLQIG